MLSCLTTRLLLTRASNLSSTITTITPLLLLRRLRLRQQQGEEEDRRSRSRCVVGYNTRSLSHRQSMATTNEATTATATTATTATTASTSTATMYEFIDTHTHIDTTMDRMGLSIEDYSRFRSETLLAPVVLDTNASSSNTNNKKKRKKKPTTTTTTATASTTSGAASEQEPDELNSNELGLIQCIYRGCVQVCAEPKSLEPSMALLDRFSDIRGAFGIHPHNASEYTDEIESKLCLAQRHASAVAWGEIGLDYHYNLSPPDVQRRVFERQMEMAVSLGKPVVIHSRCVASMCSCASMPLFYRCT